jgi:alginate O-acetyltransferase complex protein AlgI
MLFNSFKFLFLFVPVVVLAYRFCVHRVSTGAAQLLLIAASLVFYASAGPAHLPLLLASIVTNYALARGIAALEGKNRKRLLFLGITVNIVFLASFKYLNLLLRHLPSSGWHLSLPDWGFPLGISFFTLQQIMYLVDTYEKLVAPNDLVSHAAWVSFFPTVTSGPLTRARQMVPQLKQATTAGAPEMARALTLIAIGLFKKVVFADSFARIADAGFSRPGAISALEAWGSSFAYTFQVYFDFGGYSDIAIGLALLLGLALPVNFNTPYRSLSVIEFWQRWHITLSRFITTYLYTPIIRSFRKATLTAAAVSTLLAMTIAGIWHGPSLTFLVFGFLHGAALAVNQVWRKRIKVAIPKVLAWAMTILFVNLAFIFFRSSSLSAALAICRALVSPHAALSTAVLRESIRLAEVPVILLPILAGVPMALLGRNSNEFTREPNPSLRISFAVVAMLLVSFLFMNSTIAREFVYFGF